MGCRSRVGHSRRPGSHAAVARLAAAAPIGPLAWELPYAAGVALKRKKKKNERKSKETNILNARSICKENS